MNLKQALEAMEDGKSVTCDKYHDLYFSKVEDCIVGYYISDDKVVPIDQYKGFWYIAWGNRYKEYKKVKSKQLSQIKIGTFFKEVSPDSETIYVKLADNRIAWAMGKNNFDTSIHKYSGPCYPCNWLGELLDK